MLAALAMSTIAATSQLVPSAWTERWTDWQRWTHSRFSLSETNEVNQWISPPMAARSAFDDLVISWNAELPPEAHLEVSVRVLDQKEASPFFSFGTWNTVEQRFGQTSGFRTSIDGQSNPFGKVLTDTLLLSQPVTHFEVRIVYFGSQPKTLNLRNLVGSFRNSKSGFSSRASNKLAWGKTLDVPMLCQGDYANGGVICSPTSTTMLLQYWGRKVGRLDWVKSVPEVVAGVFDIAWKGTGNWIFNTAFAGSLGLQGESLRLNDLRDLEDLTAAGFPVATSVSYDLLKGKGKKGDNDGHIVVLIGFDANGNPVFNDPGRRETRQTYQRMHFEEAWKTSDRTVYLIHPPTVKPPTLSTEKL